MNYKNAVINRSEKQCKLLEFTSDLSFEIVGAILTVELGGTNGAGAAAGAATGVLKSAAGEFGKYLAGTSEGSASAAEKIILEGVMGAASGFAGQWLKLKGDKIVEGAAEAAAKKLGGKWIGGLSKAKVENFSPDVLKDPRKAAFRRLSRTHLRYSNPRQRLRSSVRKSRQSLASVHG